jgi:small subunit ribosomal protein S14
LAKKALIEKWKNEPKFEVRRYNRCKVCGYIYEGASLPED